MPTECCTLLSLKIKKYIRQRMAKVIGLDSGVTQTMIFLF
jgi:hypothetical protein